MEDGITGKVDLMGTKFCRVILQTLAALALALTPAVWAQTLDERITAVAQNT